MAANPTFSQFNPRDIPWQYVVKKFMRETYDYKTHGLLELMLSGAVGSAKSIFACNMGASHCLMYSDAVLGLFRLSMPDLKETIYATMIEHIDGAEIVLLDNGKEYKDTMREGVHYTTVTTQGKIDFINGAKVRSKSWSDKRWGKLRSHNYSAGILEEYTENPNEIIEKAYDEVVSRVGRVSSTNSNVQENWLLSLTNPDGESHHGHQYFISGSKKIFFPVDYRQVFDHVPEEHHLYAKEIDYKKDVIADKKEENRWTFYSLTKDNPYLDPNYVRGLEKRLSPIQKRRKLDGEWVDDQSGKIYSSYSQERNLKGVQYVPNEIDDMWVSWDFNIGEGKPLSACMAQYEKKKDHFHYFAESIISGADTRESLEDMATRGLFDYPVKYYIAGDGTNHRTTSTSKKSDWDIIEEYFENYRTPTGKKVNFEKVVKRSNPPVRSRHNDVNGYLFNSLEEVRVSVYVWEGKDGEKNQGCPTLDKGFRLTVLKPGGAYIENDGPAHPYQHVTTAAGYMICSAINEYDETTNGQVYRR